MPKIIAPVSSVEGAMRVLDAGADELYCGVRLKGSKYLSYSGRPGSCCLPDYEDLRRVVELAHAGGATVSLTANLPFMADAIKWFVRDFLKRCVGQGIDALIVGDLGALLLVREMDIKLPIYASSFLVVRNEEAASLLKKLGVSRIIAPQDATLDELSTLVEKCRPRGVEIEAFVHGENCSNVGGNCYLLHCQRPPREVYAPYDGCATAAIAGSCAHDTEETLVSVSARIPCLFFFDAWEIDQDQRVHEVGRLPIIDAFRFCSLCRLPELVATGVAGLKIVGRCQPVEFQVKTTSVYRELVSLIEQGRMDQFHEEVNGLRESSPALRTLCREKRCYYSPLFASPGRPEP